MIHPTAIVEPGAILGADVEIGPYAVIEKDVVLGDRVKIGPHAHLLGRTFIGDDTRVHASAVLGDEPQDSHYQGLPSETRIGKRCRIREFVTIHRGAKENGCTRIGDDCMLMATAHVAHDCVIGNHVIIANSALLAGHVTVEEKAFISGNAVIHQFCRIGALAMIGGAAGVGQDIPPFCLYQYGFIQGLNSVGLRRNGYDTASRLAMKRAFKLFFHSGLARANAVEQVRQELAGNAAVDRFCAFIDTTRRGIATAPRGRAAAGEDAAENDAT